jgi:3-oxoacyl-[acyl-carrier protein] reductase
MGTDVEHFDLSGRRALVIGAETAAGGAIARAYGEAGARVALCVAETDPARDAAKALQEDIGPDSSVLVAGDPARADQVVRDAAAKLGGLDVLASCPDLFLAKPFSKTSEDELRQLLEANFVAQFVATREAVTAMRQNESGGNIALLTHVLGERGLTNTAAYGAAQAATHSLVRSLAQELGPARISINGIALGWMDWMDDRLDAEDEEAARAVRFTILKRAGRADDVGPLAVWLAGSGVGYVTGQVFSVDGGLLQHL